jgi:thiaminase
MIFRKRNRAEQNESNYQKWLKTYIPETTKQRIELTRVFTDRAGNNFYILKNPANLTRERAQRIEEAMTAIDFGINKTEVVEKLKRALEQRF